MQRACIANQLRKAIARFSSVVITLIGLSPGYTVPQVRAWQQWTGSRREEPDARGCWFTALREPAPRGGDCGAGRSSWPEWQSDCRKRRCSAHFQRQSFWADGWAGPNGNHVLFHSPQVWKSSIVKGGSLPQRRAENRLSGRPSNHFSFITGLCGAIFFCHMMRITRHNRTNINIKSF